MLTASESDGIIVALVEMGVVPVPGVVLSEDIRFQAVFMMDSGGSGKSTIVTKNYLTHIGFKTVDADSIMKRHPDYDPENPAVLHPWSKEVAQAEFKRIIEDGTGTPVVYDGTGKRSQDIARHIQDAQEQGYNTYLVYVYVPLEVSIWRNRNRERFVKETVIQEQRELMQDNYRRLEGMVTKAKVVVNYENSELEQAQRDIELYPVPQKVRPPRPGDVDYGKQESIREGGFMNKISRELASIAASLIKAGDEWYDDNTLTFTQQVKRVMTQDTDVMVTGGRKNTLEFDYFAEGSDGIPLVLTLQEFGYEGESESVNGTITSKENRSFTLPGGFTKKRDPHELWQGAKENIIDIFERAKGRRGSKDVSAAFERMVTLMEKAAKRYIEVYGEEFKDDAEDLKAIGDLIKQGNFDAAAKKAKGLDTIVRDSIPDNVWDFLASGAWK